MKRIAIPVASELLSENFGECSYYKVYEVEKVLKSVKTAVLPDKISISELPVWLQGEGITDVITHKIDRRIISLFAAEKISLFVGISIDNPEKLIEDYLQGKLVSDKKVIDELMTNK